MLDYIIRRVLFIIPTLLGIMFLNFLLVQFVPGGPVEQMIYQFENGSNLDLVGGGGTDAGQENNSNQSLSNDSKYKGAQGLPEEFIKDPMFERCAWRTGFRQLRPEEKLINGDLLFMSILTTGLNHVAIFIDGDVLHHLGDRLSCKEPYNPWLLKCTGGRYRYDA